MSTTNTPYLSIAQLAGSPTAQIDDAVNAALCELRVCCPGVIQSFDSTEQTVTVRLAIKEEMIVNQRANMVQIPDLIKVPIIIPRGGQFLLTVPIVKGDECLVIFGDQCVDGWWQSGGAQNPLELRRHNLSDGFAVLGTWSQPNVVSNYSTNSAQLRSLDGTVIVDVAEAGVTVTSPKVSLNTTGDVDVTTTGDTNVTATGNVTVTGSKVTLGNATTIDSRVFLNHKHSGVQGGSSVTGGVV